MRFTGPFLSAALVAGLALAPAAQANVIETVVLGPTGGGAPLDIRQPSLGMTALVKNSGVFGEVGRVQWFAGNFAPRGYLSAAGQLLSIADNQALFSKLGTIYGGDGRTTFALPDLRGRSIMGVGGNYSQGQRTGAETTTLGDAQMPSHAHLTGDGLTSTSAGGAAAIGIMQPSLVLDYEIVTQGIYPSRSLQAEPGEVGTNSELLGFVNIDAAVVNDPDLDGRRANGALLPIAQNAALFSLLGTTYGGDGRTTFALPDLGGRLATGTGTGPGLVPVQLGQERGSETTTMTVATMPAHSHSDPDPDYATTLPTGGGQPLSSIQPELALNYVIALQGIFPSRNLMAPASTGGEFEPAPITSDPFLGEVNLFAGNFAPRGWAFAAGQILPISQYSALFSLLGTVYGGDGRTTFALPDLRGRTPLGIGSGPGLTQVRLGERLGGSGSLPVQVANLPSHIHSVNRVVPVPIPASALLLLGALAGLGGMRVRLRV